MEKVADIIVDVPLAQTNQSYTYRLPPALSERIQVGMRVLVPFGRGNKTKQGFCVALREVATVNPKWKEVQTLEEDSVLSTELLSLAKYMAETSFSFYVTCLQTMLPKALKRKFYSIYLPQSTEPEVQALFAQKVAPVGKNEPQVERQLKRWVQEGKVCIQEQEQERSGQKKYEKIALVLASKEELQAQQKTARANAKQWKALLHLLAEKKPQYRLKAYAFPLAQWRKAEAKGLVKIEEVEVQRLNFPSLERSVAFTLNEEQQQAKDTILQAVIAQQDQVFLLEGVTGSGKTEVYMQVIATVLSLQKTALVLVPEISLTTQIVQRFRARFGDRVALLHSGLNAGEKYEEWRRIEAGTASIVIGTRSAIFAPLENIGVIIIDEEQAASYKQEEAPRYHAREMAIFRSHYQHCPLVLGSATPSLETRAKAYKGRYERLLLTKRAQDQRLPQVQLVDMRQVPRHQACPEFSEALLFALYQRLQAHEQSILLLNRRGYATFVQCELCGTVLTCPNCDISLTYHKTQEQLSCHYCGFSCPVPLLCPHCRSKQLYFSGTGTQKIEEQLQALFPTARILRMDVDTTRKKGSHEHLLQQFEKGEADILLGTQMIAKGLDFPNVTFVGVLDADASLHCPDFRASERCFQLLTQVSGRAGRGTKSGMVYIQTYNPEHYALQAAVHQDYERFFIEEMQYRHLAHYSPYYYQLALTIKSEDAKLGLQYAKMIKEELCQHQDQTTFILGPGDAAVRKIKKQYYYQILIKHKKDEELLHFLEQQVPTWQLSARQGVFIQIDNDPLQLL